MRSINKHLFNLKLVVKPKPDGHTAIWLDKFNSMLSFLFKRSQIRSNRWEYNLLNLLMTTQIALNDHLCKYIFNKVITSRSISRRM